MKKLLVLVLAVVMVLSVMAVASADDEMRVAMITDYGDITDQSFNQTTYEAAKAWCEENGIVEAFVTTAAPLTDAQKKAVAARLSDMSSKKVTLIERVDPAVMGGLREDMQGKRYDNTIQHRLALMRRHLTEE